METGVRSTLNSKLSVSHGVNTRGSIRKQDKEVLDINYDLQDRGTIADCQLSTSTYRVVVIPNFAVPAHTFDGVALPLSLAVWNGEVTIVERNRLSTITTVGERKIINTDPLPTTGWFYSTIDSQDNIITCSYGQHCIRRFVSIDEHCQTVGTYGSGPLQFKHPSGIAVHPITRNIFVVDSRNHRVQILYPDLTFCDSFGGKGSSYGEFNEPCDIAMMPLIESSSLQNNCVRVLANSLPSLREVSQLPLPMRLKGIMIQYIVSDSVYVTDRYNHRVQVFSSSGKYIKSFGSDRLSEPTGIAVDNYGVVYVCEKGKHCITLFTTSGEYIQRVGGSGDIPLQFNQPLAIAADANGSMCVYNGGTECVSVFL